MSWVEVFPVAALLLFITGDTLQLKTTWGEKTAKGLSLERYMIGMFINCLFSIYYFILTHYIALALNLVMGLIMLTILILGLKYRRMEDKNDGPDREHS